MSIVVEFQSSNINILANKGNNKIIELRTNTIALNTIHLIEWSYVTVRYAKRVLVMPPNCFNTSNLNVRHIKIWDQCFQKIADHMHVFLPCLDFTELSPLQKLPFLIGDACYYLSQVCGDFFDRIGKIMLKRMYVCRSSVLNIDWNVILIYYLNYFLLLYLYNNVVLAMTMSSTLTTIWHSHC